MSLHFDPVLHEYTLDGVRVPSVTQTLQASGLIDFSHVPERIIQAAKDRGTAVHRACHYWLEHDLDVLQFQKEFPSYAGYLESLIALFEVKHLVTVACELRVASYRYQFGGTLDWIGLFDGDGAILDWATGAPDDVSKDLQTAAYELAARECMAEDDRLRDFFQNRCRKLTRIAVRLSKSGALPRLERYTDPRHHSEFVALVTARRIVEQRKGESAAWLKGVA